MTDPVSQPSPPMWKRLFDAIDQHLSPTLNELARREEIVTLAGLVMRGRADLDRAAERLSRRALHILNLPAGSDVNRLLAHIAQVERELRDLRNRIADRDHAEFLANLQAQHDR